MPSGRSTQRTSTSQRCAWLYHPCFPHQAMSASCIAAVDSAGVIHQNFNGDASALLDTVFALKRENSVVLACLFNAHTRSQPLVYPYELDCTI